MKNFEELDNCDPVLLCSSTDMETIWAWCVVLIHQYFWTQTVWKKKKKPSRFCVIKREYSNKLYELRCSPIKPTCITETIIWPTSGPLVLKSRKKDYKECICLLSVSHFLIAITGSKSAILLSS